MSSSVSTRAYEPVADSRRHYRTILQSTARPGLIGQLEDSALEIPSQLNRASAFLALTLLSSDSSFYLAAAEPATIEFLRRETLAKPAEADAADFLFLKNGSSLEEVEQARMGTLAYPDSAATLVLQVEGISPAPLAGALRLALQGPGIETESSAFVAGAPEALFAMLQRLNEEFPLGIDTYLTCDSLSAGPCMLALPRTTRVRWERI